jgi:hypothetical protein
MYPSCASISTIADEWPLPRFGPISRKKFGKPATVVPR